MYIYMTIYIYIYIYIYVYICICMCVYIYIYMREAFAPASPMTTMARHATKPPLSPPCRSLSPPAIRYPFGLSGVHKYGSTSFCYVCC